MPSLWTFINTIAFFLDPDERQQVLGDIQERGPDIRAFFDLLGLILLRQLQAWMSWRPWALTFSLAIPMIFAAYASHPVALIAHSGHLLSFKSGWGTFVIEPRMALGAPAFAWATGFVLGRLGKRRAASVVLILIGLSAVLTYSTARQVFQIALPPSWTAYFQLITTMDQQIASAVQLVRQTYRFVFAIGVMMLLTAFPCIHGWYRGQQRRPLSLTIAIVVAGTAVAAQSYRFGIRNASPQATLLLFVAIWPILYVLATSRRDVLKRSRYN
jgi:hypothetical protein